MCQIFAFLSTQNVHCTTIEMNLSYFAMKMFIYKPLVARLDDFCGLVLDALFFRILAGIEEIFGGVRDTGELRKFIRNARSYTIRVPVNKT